MPCMVTTTQMIFVLSTSENVSRSPLARGDVVDRRTDGGRLVLLGVGRHSHQQAHRHEGHQVRIGHDFRLYLWVISPAQSWCHTLDVVPSEAEAHMLISQRFGRQTNRVPGLQQQRQQPPVEDAPDQNQQWVCHVAFSLDFNFFIDAFWIARTHLSLPQECA